MPVPANGIFPMFPPLNTSSADVTSGLAPDMASHGSSAAQRRLTNRRSIGAPGGRNYAVLFNSQLSPVRATAQPPLSHASPGLSTPVRKELPRSHPYTISKVYPSRSTAPIESGSIVTSHLPSSLTGFKPTTNGGGLVASSPDKFNTSTSTTNDLAFLTPRKYPLESESTTSSTTASSHGLIASNEFPNSNPNVRYFSGAMQDDDDNDAADHHSSSPLLHSETGEDLLPDAQRPDLDTFSFVSGVSNSSSLAASLRSAGAAMNNILPVHPKLVQMRTAKRQIDELKQMIADYQNNEHHTASDFATTNAAIASTASTVQSMISQGFFPTGDFDDEKKHQDSSDEIDQRQDKHHIENDDDLFTLPTPSLHFDQDESRAEAEEGDHIISRDASNYVPRDKYQSLINQLEEKTIEYELIVEKYNAIQLQLKTARQEKDALEHDLSKFTQQHAIAQEEHGTLQQSLEQNNNLIASLRQQLEQALEQVATLQQSTTTLLAEKSLLEDEKVTLLKQNADLDDEKSSLASENSVLIEDKSILASQCASLVEDKSALAAANADLIAEKSALMDENSALMNQQASLTAENATLLADKATTTSSTDNASTAILLAEHAASLAAKSADNSALLEEKTALVAEKTALLAEKSSLSTENATLSAQNATLLQEKATLIAEQAERETYTESIETALEQLSVDKKAVEAELQTKKEKLERKNLKYEDLIRQITQLQARLITVQQQSDKFEDENKQLTDELQGIFDEQNSSKSSLNDSSIANVSTYSTPLPDSNTSLSEQDVHRNYSHQIDELNHEIEQLQQERRLLREEIAHHNEAVDEAHRLEMIPLTELIVSLQNSLENAEQENQRLRLQLSRHVDSVAQIAQTQTQLQSELQNNVETIASAQEMLSNVHSSKFTNQEEILALQAQIEELQQALAAQQSSQHDSDDLLHKLESMNQQQQYLEQSFSHSFEQVSSLLSHSIEREAILQQDILQINVDKRALVDERDDLLAEKNDFVIEYNELMDVLDNLQSIVENTINDICKQLDINLEQDDLEQKFSLSDQQQPQDSNPLDMNAVVGDTSPIMDTSTPYSIGEDPNDLSFHLATPVKAPKQKPALSPESEQKRQMYYHLRQLLKDKQADMQQLEHEVRQLSTALATGNSSLLDALKLDDLQTLLRETTAKEVELRKELEKYQIDDDEESSDQEQQEELVMEEETTKTNDNVFKHSIEQIVRLVQYLQHANVQYKLQNEELKQELQSVKSQPPALKLSSSTMVDDLQQRYDSLQVKYLALSQEFDILKAQQDEQKLTQEQQQQSTSTSSSDGQTLTQEDVTNAVQAALKQQKDELTAQFEQDSLHITESLRDELSQAFTVTKDELLQDKQSLTDQLQAIETQLRETTTKHNETTAQFEQLTSDNRQLQQRYDNLNQLVSTLSKSLQSAAAELSAQNSFVSNIVSQFDMQSESLLTKENELADLRSLIATITSTTGINIVSSSTAALAAAAAGIPFAIDSHNLHPLGTEPYPTASMFNNQDDLMDELDAMDQDAATTQLQQFSRSFSQQQQDADGKNEQETPEGHNDGDAVSKIRVDIPKGDEDDEDDDFLDDDVDASRLQLSYLREDTDQLSPSTTAVQNIE